MRLTEATILASLLAASAAHAQNVLMMNGTGNNVVLRAQMGERAQTISINFQLSMPARPDQHWGQYQQPRE